MLILKSIIMKIYLVISFCLFLTSAVICQESTAPCIPCQELSQLQLPDVSITSSAEETDEVDFCKVMGTIGKEINFELLLPLEWNERFVMGGGGGYVGEIQNSARSKVGEGYATVGTDTGHKGSGIQASWALHKVERQLNFGHLAIHRTATVAKAIIRAFYCKDARYNYFMGCSRGGGQALIEAQRYPNDFDGIVCAAPIIDWSATGGEFIQNIQALYPDPDNLKSATLSKEKVELLAAQVVDQCDARDGVEDGIINDPVECNLDYSRFPVCSNGQSNDCFTEAEIQVIKTIYEGPDNNTGKIYPGFPPGAEAHDGGWMSWIVGPDPNLMQLNYPSLHYAFGTEFFKYFVFSDPDWDYSQFDLDELHEKTSFVSSFMNATQTDYRSFKNHGGKMIIYHGWNDPALSAYTTIDHYEEAMRMDPDLADHIRLYLLPGVLHCGGGPGPSKADWLDLVRQWVENDQAPQEVIVSKNVDDNTVLRRPVYPYPGKAVYSGDGDTNDPTNFSEQK